MAAVTSVHFADVGVRAALRAQARPPQAGRVPGLVHGDIGLAAPLGPSLVPHVTLGRIGFVAFWNDEPSLDRFLTDHRIGRALATGWEARLEPTRVHGTWPGLGDGLPKARTAPHEGPAIVLTLGRVRPSQFPRFLKTSAKAEGAVVNAPGVEWASGLAKPPFVATCSVWESVDALAAYAYGSPAGAHPGAITADRAEPFHRRSAFVRFRPLRITGRLGGPNPTP